MDNKLNFNDIAEIELFDDRIDLKCIHAQVSATLNGTYISGFGSDKSDNVALFKAVSEFFERLTVKNVVRKGETSSGFACHESIELARISAAAELIERDFLTRCWLLRRSPCWLNISDLPGAIKDEADLFHLKGFQLKFGILGQAGPIKVYLSLINMSSLQSGFVLATCADINEEHALAKLMLDNRRIASVLLNRLDEGLSLFTKIAPADIKQPKDVFDFYLNPKNIESLSWFINETSNPLIEPMPDFEFDEYKDFSIEPPWPLIVSRATCNLLQLFYVGTPTLKQINFNRLALNDQSFHSLNLLPHPLA